LDDSRDLDLESEDFRTALLDQLNGQSKELNRLIKLVDLRFRSHSTRIRELEKAVTRLSDIPDQVEALADVAADVKFVKRLALLAPVVLGVVATILGILR